VLKHLTRRELLAGAAATAATLALPSRIRAAGNNVSAATFPGIWDELTRSTLVPEFTKNTGAGVMLSPLLGLDQVAKIKASPNEPPLDIALMDPATFSIASKDGLFSKFSAHGAKNYADLLPMFTNTAEGYGPTVAVQVVGITYNADRVKNPPRSWVDLANFKGRIGLVSLNSILGVEFMVALAKAHNGSEENIEPAFAALRAMMPNVVSVAQNPGNLAQLFKQGEIDVAPQFLDFAAPLKAAGLPIEWIPPKEGAIANNVRMCVVANTKTDPKLAAAYIDAAIGQAFQSVMATTRYSLVPTNRKVVPPPQIAGKYGKDGSRVVDHLVTLDWTKISPRRAGWLARFNQESTS
jgi:putative spermidine/putrescine transport system substrate-binding protein